MEISESSKLYLKNYYVLDQARTEAHEFLERIVNQSANQFEEYLKDKNNGSVRFEKYVQKDGGSASFVFERKEPIPGLTSIDSWKFSINYIDAMRSDDLSSPTLCRIYCFAPKSHGKQISEINRMTNKLNLPDLFKPVEIDLLNAPQEDVISAIKNQFIDFYDQFIKLVTALIEEAHES